MWENRISVYFEDRGDRLPQAPVPQQAAPTSAAGPNLVQRADIYQAAHARALFEQQLTRLFNADGNADGQ
jgi:hypothetical protein